MKNIRETRKKKTVKGLNFYTLVFYIPFLRIICSMLIKINLKTSKYVVEGMFVPCPAANLTVC